MWYQDVKLSNVVYADNPLISPIYIVRVLLDFGERLTQGLMNNGVDSGQISLEASWMLQIRILVQNCQLKYNE